MKCILCSHLSSDNSTVNSLVLYLSPFGVVVVSVWQCLGDQSAALVGQNCLSPGMAKNTYGTGCFLLCNTGTTPTLSHHGLLTTVAYQLGPHEPVNYALEGSIANGGQVVEWLKDKLGFIEKPEDVGERGIGRKGGRDG